MKKYLYCAFFTVGTLLAPAQASADKGDWLVRVRLIDIMPHTSSSATLGGAIPSDAIDVKNSGVRPELDLSYFLTTKLALELILGLPYEHDVTLSAPAIGAIGKVGTIKHLPPTLTLQYHFTPDAAFSPYVGAGINYTHFTSVNLTANTGLGPVPLNIKRDSWGGAIQVGFDVPIQKNLVFNVDVKKVWIKTKVTDTLGLGVSSDLDINPLVVGVGLGWKF
jgi:outer membrane protein